MDLQTVAQSGDADIMWGLIGLFAAIVLILVGNRVQRGLFEKHPKAFATIVVVLLSPVLFAGVGAVATILAGVEFGQWYFAKLYFPVFGWVPFIDRIVSLI